MELIHNCGARCRRRIVDRVTRGGTASICTRPSSCRSGIGRGSSDSDGTRCVHRSPPIACTSRRMVRLCSICGTGGRTGRRSCCSSRWNCWERLAALTPRPPINLLLYYGVLGARSAWPSRLRAPDAPRAGDLRTTGADRSPRAPSIQAAHELALGGVDAAELRVRCPRVPRCGDRFELIALTEDPRVIRGILGHLGLPHRGAGGPPRALSARVPLDRREPWSEVDERHPRALTHKACGDVHMRRRDQERCAYLQRAPPVTSTRTAAQRDDERRAGAIRAVAAGAAERQGHLARCRPGGVHTLGARASAMIRRHAAPPNQIDRYVGLHRFRRLRH
jgi:hypothetical protein